MGAKAEGAGLHAVSGRGTSLQPLQLFPLPACHPATCTIRFRGVGPVVPGSVCVGCRLGADSGDRRTLQKFALCLIGSRTHPARAQLSQ